MEFSSIQQQADSSLGHRKQLNVAPPTMVNLPRTAAEWNAWNEASITGRAVLQAGKCGILLVAGGAGTRLGFPHPKGMYPIGPVTRRTLFQLFAGQVLALSKRYRRGIPFLVMTSEQTHGEIARYFREQDWFGIDPANVFLFPQGSQPVVSAESGSILLQGRSAMITSPDGHGGAIPAMENAGLYSELRSRGVESLFYYQVDNPLVHICDPTFIGFHALNKSEVSTKAVRKESAEEKAGVLVEVDGRLHVIEYSELPIELAFEQDSSGKLRWNAANTAIHLFQLDFLEQVASDPNALPWHRVLRRVSYADADGNDVDPNYANAIKCERFIFDVLPRAKRTLVVEADRTVEFAPLKSADGDCSPAAVRKAMSNAAAARLRMNGISVPEGLSIEICASVLPDEHIRLRPGTVNRTAQSIVVGKAECFLE